MNFEEEKSRFERMCSRVDAEEKLCKAFLHKTEETLFSFPLEYWNHDSSEREKLTVHLKKLAVKYSRETFECFDEASWYYYTKTKPVKNFQVVHSVITRKEAEKQLREKLKDIPEDKDYFCKVFWETFEKSHKREMFFYSLHKKLKEILTEYYEKDILDFDGYILRSLDSSVYYRVVCPFIDDYFCLVSPRSGVLKQDKTD